MTTIETSRADLFVELNARRVSAQMNPLAVNKLSRANLVDAIAALPPVVAPPNNRGALIPADAVSLADLARECNMNPKIVRARARRHADALRPYLHPSHNNATARHVYRADARDALVAFIANHVPLPAVA